MTSVLTERWLWIVILSLIAILVTPLLVVWAIFTLPSSLRFVATILIIVAWGSAAGYKEWISRKREREQA